MRPFFRGRAALVQRYSAGEKAYAVNTEMTARASGATTGTF